MGTRKRRRKRKRIEIIRPMLEQLNEKAAFVTAHTITMRDRIGVGLLQGYGHRSAVNGF
ncbi:hypothetical protein NSMM_610018 [Nitrosomonas mobilis]|uniref:Uncharacterized protein n=1 Tax=Nitrosomonas mobilis TaxID=51642 RepID=A0A1G5SHE5_9PROT|nr:hypothetical protein NSMM_610018 [Nitrosomonas mobilis]